MKIGSLFSGYGGLDMAVVAHYDATVAWHVEFDKAPSAILAHHYPGIPNYGDVTAVDWSAVEPVDIITGGFPCQDVSHAGLRRGVHHGTRSGLWFQMARAIDALRPTKVVIENVAGLLSASAAGDVELCPWCLGDDTDGHMRALGAVLADLAEMGFDADWGSVSAAEAGAPHRRERVWIVATDAARQSGDWCRPTGEGRRPEPSDGGGNPHLTLLPTPKASDGSHGGPGMRNSRGVADALPGVVALLPTPTTRDWKDGATDPDRVPVNGLPGRAVWHDCGPYTAAIRRWESVLGRPAPAPTEPGQNGRPRLSPRFVEFMMGLPDGWVCDVSGISRSAQLKALGNGVVKQQAALALSLLDGAS